MVKIAYVHQLPMEIYPPAMNAVRLLAAEAGWEVRVWTTEEGRGMDPFVAEGVEVRRLAFPGRACGSLARFSGWAGWHVRVGRELARWNPDVVVSVEPHSALAVWWYCRVHGGRARVFVHHHEYYAPGDYRRPGSRTSRMCHWFELRDLFRRAEWVSQTNARRLELLMADCGWVTEDKARVWPNHPPAGWAGAERAVGGGGGGGGGGGELRLVCVGSLSFEDTYIREVALWAAERAGRVRLHVCGHNVRADVWEWLRGLGAKNITLQPAGVAYADLPGLLGGHDVSLVLYKGNTVNFIYNVPNKVVEGLACGLEVWYPLEMEGMRMFLREHPGLRLRELDFRRMPEEVPALLGAGGVDLGGFTAERAIAPLIRQLEGGAE